MKLHPDDKLAGVLAPLFALRGEHDLGIGDVGALRELIGWAREAGFRLVQLLPINETGQDHSPYNAVSSVALEPTTIEITPATLPDLSAGDIAAIVRDASLSKLRDGPVKYPAVKALKLRLLERAFENFSAIPKRDARLRHFQRFCREQAPWLDDYALFRVLIEENGGSECWDRWPAAQRSPKRAAAWLAKLPAARRRAIEGRIRFRKYVQWIAWEQWRALRIEAGERGVALMGDIPFGVSYYAADVWANPKIFDHQWCGGCPPERILKVDEFTYKWGQNWGIPLYHWSVLRKDDFGWWRQRVHKVRDIFHLFRIDHILGCFRIYAFPWRPERNEEFLPLNEDEAKARTGGRLPHFAPHADDTPTHQAANRAQGARLLHALIEECGEYRLVGEDLGAVPDYVRPCLRELRVAGFKIPQWEMAPDPSGLIPGGKYERLSLATYATHDHPTVREMWDAWMEAIERAETGGPETSPARDAAWAEVRRLAHWCGFEVPCITPFSAEIHERLVRTLYACESWIAVLMITDVFATKQRFNIPGAVSEANWSTRIDEPVSQWKKCVALAEKTRLVKRLARETGRMANDE
jgi:4-alpha-glucanotransferase